MDQKIKYKCSVCNNNFFFNEITEVFYRRENDSIKILYLCQKCKEASASN